MSGLEAPQIAWHQCPGTGRFLCRVRLDEPGPDGAPIRVRWAGLAENPAAQEELLVVLAKSDSRLVHLTLAHREDLPGSVGETLADRCLAAGDEHLTHALACNDQLPERVVRELAVSADPAVRAAVAVAPIPEGDLVHSFLNDPEPAVRRALTFRTGLDLSLRERLAHDADPDVRESLGYQHDLQESILTILARDPHPGVRVQVISRLARHWLPELAADPDPVIRSEVARHRDARADLLDRLSRDEDSSVRLAVCRAHRVSAKLLAVLAADSDAEVRAAVAREGKTPDTVVRRLAEDSDARVRGAARSRLAADRGPWSFEELERLAATEALNREYPRQPPADQLSQLASSQHAQLRAMAAGFPALPADFAGTLAYDRSLIVRRALACNSSAPSDALRLLISSDSGRDSHIERALAGNSNAPADVLAQLLAAQADHETRLALASNPNTPPAVLADLAQGDHEPDVLREACAHPALSRPVMWHLTAPLTAPGTGTTN